MLRITPRRVCMLFGGAVTCYSANSSGMKVVMPQPVFTSCEEDKKSMDDCLNPACHSTMDLLKKFNMRTKKKKVPKVVENKSKEDTNPYCSGCPADKDVQGRGTWQLIHSIASLYPDVPTEEEERHMDSFLRSLSMVYPCPYCAHDFQDRIKNYPPRLESREALMVWCCQFHNHVNEKLGKPIFPCTVTELDLRWKDGRDECWEGKEE
mmetsp:Transcript_28547/g.48264  ORF Transcript_28547/g.48264 Transcript_28547/m.48264 type:complete len:208 (+) Transcript_28547:99-722(+)